jgi:predicted O-methyltransferase YrrM
MLKQAVERLKQRHFERRYLPEPIQIAEFLKPCGELVIDLRNWDADLRAGDFFDSLIYAAMVRKIAPRIVFEIGTGDGRTALIAARNMAEGGRVHTLDPENDINPVKGSVFRDLPEAAAITQHRGFSQDFDFTTWQGSCDLVFVDGGHTCEDVLRDSEIALRLTRPGGFVLWHDVASDCPGVPIALKKSSRASDIRLVAGSRYAVLSGT